VGASRLRVNLPQHSSSSSPLAFKTPRLAHTFYLYRSTLPSAQTEISFLNNINLLTFVMDSLCCVTFKKLTGLKYYFNPCTGLDRSFEAPRFRDNRHVKVLRLSALRTGRLYPLPPGSIPGTHFCQKLLGPWCGRKDYVNEKDTIGNRSRVLPGCSAVRQPTASPLAPHFEVQKQQTSGSGEVIVREVFLVTIFSPFRAILG